MPWAHCQFDGCSDHGSQDEYKLIFEVEDLFDIGEAEASDLCSELAASLERCEASVKAVKVSTDAQCVVVVYLSGHWLHVAAATRVMERCQCCVRGAHYRIGFAQMTNSIILARYRDGDWQQGELP